MERFSKILAKTGNFKKLRQGFVDKRAMIITTLLSSCHWKTLVPFLLAKEKTWKPMWTIAKLYRKTNYTIQNNSKLAI